MPKPKLKGRPVAIVEEVGKLIVDGKELFVSASNKTADVSVSAKPGRHTVYTIGGHPFKNRCLVIPLTQEAWPWLRSVLKMEAP